MEALFFDESKLIKNGKTLEINPINGLKSPIITNPTLVMTNGTKSTLNISSITINGTIHSINLDGFNIAPGVKYKLKLQASCPCVLNVDPTLPISLIKTSGATQYNYDGATYGIVMDIYKLDNSFNLTINDQPFYIGKAFYDESKTRPLTDYLQNEIDFEGYDATGGYVNSLTSPIPNIEFEDGTRWAIDGFKKIWELDGRLSTGNKAIVRIIIDQIGQVKMYGSKNPTGGDPFYPLRLLNNEKTAEKRSTGSFYVEGRFNENIVWKEGINKIVLSQSKIGNDTNFTGFITGKKIIPCNQVSK